MHAETVGQLEQYFRMVQSRGSDERVAALILSSYRLSAAFVEKARTSLAEKSPRRRSSELRRKERSLRRGRRLHADVRQLGRTAATRMQSL